MTLYHTASGLLGTHVTWQDVESEMQKALGTTAKFGENRTARNISYLKGSTSSTALIDVHWIGNKVEDELPETFVIKIASQLNFVIKSAVLECPDLNFEFEKNVQKLEKFTRILHNREVDTLNFLTRLKNPMVPKIYSTRKFDETNKLKGFIISQYEDHIHDNCHEESTPFEDLKQVVEKMAEFSALGEKLEKEDSEFAEEIDIDMLNVILGEYYDEKTWEPSKHVIRRFFPSEHQSELEKLLKIYNEFYIKPGMLGKHKNICGFLGHEPVLVHGSLCRSNLQWKYSGKNGKTFIGMNDWQTVCFTSPGLDICRLIVSCLNKKDRREKTVDLLELYYNTFIEKLDNRPVPYTFQQLLDSYNLYFPLMAISEITGSAPIMEYSSNPEIQELQKIIGEDMIGLMEDVLRIHKLNEYKFSTFFEN